MGRYKGRNAVACFGCHGLKVKCSGGRLLGSCSFISRANDQGIPCQRCRARGRDCSYPVKERLLAVPESYLRSLERGIELDRRTIGDVSVESSHSTRRREGDWPSPRTTSEHDQLLEDCSAEGFVQKLKKVSLHPSDLHQHGHEGIALTSPSSSRYTYSKLNFDFFRR